MLNIGKVFFLIVPFSLCLASTKPKVLDFRYPTKAQISYISLDENGKHVLVSTSGEKKNGYPDEARVRLLSTDKKKVLFEKGLAQPIKSQHLSNNGKRIAVCSYDGKLYYWNLSDKKNWSIEIFGRPAFLENKNFFLVLNDDDSDPAMAFTIVDFDGKVLKKVELREPKNPKVFKEPIDVFLSSDQETVLVSTQNNELHAFNIEGKPLWQHSFNEKLVAFNTSVVNKDKTLFVITDSFSNKPKIRYLRAYSINKFKTMSETVLDKPYQNILISTVDSTSPHSCVFLYGNHSSGQSITCLSPTNLKTKWLTESRAPLQYSQPIFVTKLKDREVYNFLFEKMEPAGTITLRQMYGDGSTYQEKDLKAANGVFSYAVSKNSMSSAIGYGEPGEGIVEFKKN